jgi:hypothetical protein
MPLIHTGQTVDRLLGGITPITPIELPFWLGTEPLVRLEIAELHLRWPDGVPAFVAEGGAEIIRLARGRFRVV